ncbi:transcriptional repressor LexA [Aeriscardovia aeriphila]|uniref:LexA repressor n=1 Tax=Aeriscardovia aeriphila TaxID=218139 RepID=A0A261FAR0_9BIFI|nr:transcriptional repressor LexA [Aeriscardovia aeriphila]NYI25621.1 repressor LexA [Aeriscardovia aeriphila]OZG56231.1 LexA repressor [Aeriscardovia aeriphila]
MNTPQRNTNTTSNRQKQTPTSATTGAGSTRRKQLSDLTARQQQIYKSITTRMQRNGFPPSIREIASDAGLKSTSSVKHQLDQLAKDGFIRLHPNMGRAIEVLDLTNNQSITPTEAQRLSSSTYGNVKTTSAEGIYGGSPQMPSNDFDSIEVPLVGRIAAGKPITAEEHVEDTMRLPQQLVGKGDFFMLEVHGDSMIDAAICDGDYVVIRKQNNAENGQMVAALLDDEATVKTYKRDNNGHVWLLPHNPAYKPIDGTHASIMGIVATVVRKVA